MGERLKVSRYDPERFVKWKVRKAVLERDKACVYCGLSVVRVRDDSEGGPNDHWRAYDEYGRPFHFDHHIPFSKGGSSDEMNIVLACADCNLRKSIGEHPRAAIDPRQGRLALVFGEGKGNDD